jgi:hypothetical protein
VALPRAPEPAAAAAAAALCAAAAPLGPGGVLQGPDTQEEAERVRKVREALSAASLTLAAAAEPGGAAADRGEQATEAAGCGGGEEEEGAEEEGAALAAEMSDAPEADLLSLAEARARAVFPRAAHMCSGRAQGALLRVLCAAVGARRVLEVGTFTASGTLSLAAAADVQEALVPARGPARCRRCPPCRHLRAPPAAAR